MEVSSKYRGNGVWNIHVRVHNVMWRCPILKCQSCLLAFDSLILSPRFSWSTSSVVLWRQFHELDIHINRFLVYFLRLLKLILKYKYSLIFVSSCIIQPLSGNSRVYDACWVISPVHIQGSMRIFHCAVWTDWTLLIWHCEID